MNVSVQIVKLDLEAGKVSLSLKPSNFTDMDEDEDEEGAGGPRDMDEEMADVVEGSDSEDDEEGEEDEEVSG